MIVFHHKPCDPGCRGFSMSNRGDCNCATGREMVVCPCCDRTVERRRLNRKVFWHDEYRWSCGAVDCPTRPSLITGCAS